MFVKSEQDRLMSTHLNINRILTENEGICV